MTWKPTTLGALVAERAKTHGAWEALVTPTTRLTYAELHARATRSAEALAGMGIVKGDFVAILMGNDEHWVEVFVACALIGAVAVPVNTRFKSAELAFCLKETNAKALVMADRFLRIDFVALLRDAEPAIDTRLPGTALPTLREVAIVGEDVPAGCRRWRQSNGLGSDPASRPSSSDTHVGIAGSATNVDPDDLLLIQFTSGTTSYPKGVMLTHDNVIRNAWAAGTRIGIRDDDRYFNCRPFFHVGGSTLSLVMSIVAGATLVTLPTFEAGPALAMMATERCTLTSGNDTIYQMLMAHPDFDAGKLALRGGWAAAGPETMTQIVEVLGARAICSAYGLSEASPNVVMSDWRDPLEVRIAGAAKPHDGVEVRIVDDATGAIAPAGTPGEIQVRGWCVMRGYLGKPEETAKAIPADGWLRTGDLGVMDTDGRLRWVGRLKDMFRVGGENVAPAEVEEALMAHPAIGTAQVVGVPDARLGEVPAAFVTLKQGHAPTEAELIDWMKARVANFRAPRYLAIVTDFEAIGMTPSGKVQKNKLRAHAVEVLGLAKPS